MSNSHGKCLQDGHEVDNTVTSVDPVPQNATGASSEGIYFHIFHTVLSFELHFVNI